MTKFRQINVVQTKKKFSYSHIPKYNLDFAFVGLMCYFGCVLTVKFESIQNNW